MADEPALVPGRRSGGHSGPCDIDFGRQAANLPPAWLGGQPVLVDLACGRRGPLVLRVGVSEWRHSGQ